MPSHESRTVARRTTAARLAAALASAMSGTLAAADRVPERRGMPLAVFAFVAVAAGAYAIGRGVDANWDLHNYHLYNPYALLNGRVLWDVAPAGLQTYFHPGADLPFYWLVTYLPASPRTVTFLMALPHAVSAVLLFLIARRLLPPGIAGRSLAITAVLAIGLTGAALLTTVGGTMNDYQVAPLALAGLYAAMRGLPFAPDGKGAPAWLLTAGACLGVAVGLKLTFAPHGVAVAGAILGAGFPARTALRACMLYLVGAGLAFALVAGPWMLFLWNAFASPVFPQFNDIIRSPDATAVSFRDVRWFPQSLVEWLFYPFLWAFETSARISEWRFRDPRIAAALIGLLLGAAALVWRTRQRRGAVPDPATGARRAWRMLVGFFLVGYVAWLLLFGYLRYLGPLELLAGLPIIGAIFLAAPRGPFPSGAVAGGLSAAAAFVIIASTQLPPWQRLPFGDRFFSATIPQLESRGLVLLIGKPVAYIAALMPRDARFVAIAHEMVHPKETHGLAEKARAIIASHDGPLYVIEFTSNAPNHGSLLAAYQLARTAEDCKPIIDGSDYGPKQLCRLERMIRR